jgi:uncharacterized membrane protein YkvA (DUF1232 family)
MNHSHLLTIEKEARLSPEQLAEKLGVSGMTLRRWRDLPSGKELPPLYTKAIIGVVHQLVNDGKLSIESSSVKAVVSEQQQRCGESGSLQPGFSGDVLEAEKLDLKNMTQSLFEMGSNEFKRSEVEKSAKKILSFKKKGRGWASRISSLMAVLKSDELHLLDKLVAYGAFFYLINPFDLVPDYIPVFGYMDDFFILGLAAAYYAKRFPSLVKAIKTES